MILAPGGGRNFISLTCHSRVSGNPVYPIFSDFWIPDLIGNDIYEKFI